jgi:hypothetical protein
VYFWAYFALLHATSTCPLFPHPVETMQQLAASCVK